MTSAQVFFYPLSETCSAQDLIHAMEKVFNACEPEKRIAHSDFVAIKCHVGEKNNDTHVPAEVYKPLGNIIKSLGGQPFLTETSTLYRGERENAIKHLIQAQHHGFSFEMTGLPFIMADGLAGNTETEVVIPGELNTKVKIAREVLLADALVSVAHLTGHLGSGFGATLKNLGMGCASRMGKMRQHSSMRPIIQAAACTFCQKCMHWCPQNTIVEKSGKAFIEMDGCIGCGECVAVCRFNAVKYNWGMDMAQMEKHIAEHALGVIQNKRDKCIFINVATQITGDCDCMDYKQEKIIPNIGVLASLDPVAIDQASLDLTQSPDGTDLVQKAYPEIDGTVQLAHGVKIGLGTREYQLVNLI
jgi:uncharacterized protein